MNERLTEIAARFCDGSPPGVPVPLQPPAGTPMTDAELDQIVSLMRAEAAERQAWRQERQAWRQQMLTDFEAALLRTLHPSVLRPAPALPPVPANDPEPDPPLHAA